MTNKLFYFIETNIDEILSLPNLSSIPITFLTEIQQDQVYGTILHELQKKIPHQNALTSPPLIALPIHEEQNALSPHLLAIDDDNDDDLSITDDISSSVSSGNNASPLPDDYDTDIEAG
jgi:hypothetical protein